MSAVRVHRKWIRGNPSYSAWEAAGLRWLTASGGVRAVEVLDIGTEHLDLVRLYSVPPTVAAAEEFGAALARTHDAGAAAYGIGPDGWDGDGWLGPSNDLLPLSLRPTARWGEFYAEQRIRATLRLGADRRVWSAADRVLFERVAARVAGGEFDDADPPARLHGDLWAGNVMWTADGAVVIDPAAHGGHRETDMGMLAFVGAPHLGRIVAAYEEVHPLTAGWERRARLHQLHPIMLHAVLFGGGYVSQSIAYARQYV